MQMIPHRITFLVAAVGWALGTVATISAQSMRTGPIPDRFTSFTFDAVTGKVPIGWDRGWASSGDLRMTPRGSKSAWLDLALLKVATDSSKLFRTAAGFLRMLLSDEPSMRFQDESPDRAYGWRQYVTGPAGKSQVNRTWHLALRVGRDSMYVLTATASSSFPTTAPAFDPQFIADAERTVLSLTIRK